MHLWGVFTISVVFYGKFPTLKFSGFKKIQKFVSKNPSIFFFLKKKTNFKGFEKIFFPTPSALKLHWKFKEARFFQKACVQFFLEKSQKLNVLKIFTLSVAFYGQVATLSKLKENSFFSQQIHLFFFKTTQIQHVLRTFTISVGFYGKISTFTVFWF